MALSALDNENRLRQIRGVDDCKLRAGRRRRQDENDCSDYSPSHHDDLLPLRIESPAQPDTLEAPGRSLRTPSPDVLRES